MESAGVFGPKLSGKTTLAKHLSRLYWTRQRRRSLVLDPNLEDWGPHAWVTKDEAKFWEIVWKEPATPSLVIVEESTEMIARNEELTPVFTRLRHLHHKLIVIGHNGTTLLPIMREQIDTLYLFRMAPRPAKMWAEDMTQPGFEESVNLEQYEFLYGQRYVAPVKRKLDLKKLQKQA